MQQGDVFRVEASSQKAEGYSLITETPHFRARVGVADLDSPIFVRVQAVNGDLASAFTPPYRIDPEPLAPPSDFRVQIVQGTAGNVATLTWTRGDSRTTEYEVGFAKDEKKSDWQEIARTPSVSVVFAIPKDVISGAVLQFRVRAIRAMAHPLNSEYVLVIVKNLNAAEIAAPPPPILLGTRWRVLMGTPTLYLRWKTPESVPIESAQVEVELDLDGRGFVPIDSRAGGLGQPYFTVPSGEGVWASPQGANFDFTACAQSSVDGACGGSYLVRARIRTSDGQSRMSEALHSCPGDIDGDAMYVTRKQEPVPLPNSDAGLLEPPYGGRYYFGRDFSQFRPEDLNGDGSINILDKNLFNQIKGTTGLNGVPCR